MCGTTARHRSSVLNASRYLHILLTRFAMTAKARAVCVLVYVVVCISVCAVKVGCIGSQRKRTRKTRLILISKEAVGEREEKEIRYEELREQEKKRP